MSSTRSLRTAYAAPPHAQQYSGRRTKSPSSSMSAGPDSSRHSSLQQLWAEDPLASTEPDTDDAGGFFSLPPPPPRATLSSPRLIQRNSQTITEDEQNSRSTRQRQKVSSLLSLRRRSSSHSPPAVPEDETDTFMSSLTGDEGDHVRVPDRSRGINSWFSGSSTPMAVGIPVADQESSSRPSPATLPSPVEKSRKRGESLSTSDPAKSPSSASTSTSRFSFFGAKSPKKEFVQLPANMVANDTLLTLSLSTVLFPNGVPSETDPFSPSAFKNLLHNAETLLTRLQTAYKLQAVSLHEMKSESEVQQEELEEAETRASHLKTQLGNLAQQVAEQDKVVEGLVEELANEREARRRDIEAREKSISFIKQHRLASQQRCGSSASVRSDDLDVDIEEDLGILTARTRSRRDPRWRLSNDSTSVITTSTINESDDETDTHDSVFSRSRSPTFLDSSAASIMTAETESPTSVNGDHQFTSSGRLALGAAAQRVYGMRFKAHNTSHPVRNLKGGSQSQGQRAVQDNNMNNEDDTRCSNCSGSSASVAWDTVSLLKVENKELKLQFQSMDRGVDGALDLLSQWGY